jgi:hypothetical protein
MAGVTPVRASRPSGTSKPSPLVRTVHALEGSLLCSGSLSLGLTVLSAISCRLRLRCRVLLKSELRELRAHNIT